MQYLGSKRRISKYILPIMLEERKPDQYWVEPFVGGCNMIDKVDGNRIGSDINYYLIELLKEVSNGWIPPRNVDEKLYNHVKNNMEIYKPCFVGFVGFLCSFANKWWGGYARNKKCRNYANTGCNSLLKQADKLKGIDFRCCSYLNLEIPPNSLIYCDPPYVGKTKYKDSINHDTFWQWCRDKTEEGHIVYVSEMEAPEDFICITEVKLATSINNKVRTERLFKPR